MIFRTFIRIFGTILSGKLVFLPKLLYLCVAIARVMLNTHLIISTSVDLLRVAASHILYISSDGNYCNFFMTGGEMRMVTYQLGQVERMIAEQLPELSRHFVRIGKSLIVNLNYVYYIHVTKQQLILVDAQLNRYTLSASREALKALKDLIESTGV